MLNYPWASEKGDAEDVLKRMKETQGVAASQCVAIEADLSTLDGPQKLVDQALKVTGSGHIDILVNNAGIAMMRPLQDVAIDQWDAQVNLNARGMLLLTQAVLPYLAQDSRIVNVSSVGARQGYVGSTIYNGTKSMVESFTRCWALLVKSLVSSSLGLVCVNDDDRDRELGSKYKCTVNAVEPGPTNTSGFNHSGPGFLAKLQPLLDATPMGARTAEPREIAYAIAFFCEPRAGWITGACLPVNGGFFMP